MSIWWDFRRWLVARLAGKSTVIVNLEVNKDGPVIRGQHWIIGPHKIRDQNVGLTILDEQWE